MTRLFARIHRPSAALARATILATTLVTTLATALVSNIALASTAQAADSTAAPDARGNAGPPQVSSTLIAGELGAARPWGHAEARGKYLVSTSGCHDCHTPLKMGAKGPEPDMTRALSGHPQALKMPAPPRLPEGPWLVTSAATNTAFAGPWGVSFTANLTPEPDTGLGDWSLRNFVDTIRTGRHLGRGREVLPPMPIPVYNNFTDSDLEAIYRYLRTIPPIQNRVPEPVAPVALQAAAQK